MRFINDIMFEEQAETFISILNAANTEQVLNFEDGKVKISIPLFLERPSLREELIKAINEKGFGGFRSYSYFTGGPYTLSSSSSSWYHRKTLQVISGYIEGGLLIGKDDLTPLRINFFYPENLLDNSPMSQENSDLLIEKYSDNNRKGTCRIL